MDFIELKVDQREKIGKASRALRAEGLVPAILYGNSSDTIPLQLYEKEVFKLIQDGHRNAILKLKGLGKDTTAIIKEIQKDSTKDSFLHLDFMQVQMDTEIETALAIELTGEAEGVTLGGVLQQNLRELTIKALPKDIPEKYTLDISELQVGSAIKISDLKPIPGVELLGSPDDVILSIVVPTKEEEVVEEVELEEGEEGAEEGAPAEEGEGAAKEGGEEEPKEQS